jgi:hypothetical protein
MALVQALVSFASALHIKGINNKVADSRSAVFNDGIE